VTVSIVLSLCLFTEFSVAQVPPLNEMEEQAPCDAVECDVGDELNMGRAVEIQMAPGVFDSMLERFFNEQLTRPICDDPPQCTYESCTQPINYGDESMCEPGRIYPFGHSISAMATGGQDARFTGRELSESIMSALGEVAPSDESWQIPAGMLREMGLTLHPENNWIQLLVEDVTIGRPNVLVVPPDPPVYITLRLDAHLDDARRALERAEFYVSPDNEANPDLRQIDALVEALDDIIADIDANPFVEVQFWTYLVHDEIDAAEIECDPPVVDYAVDDPWPRFHAVIGNIQSSAPLDEMSPMRRRIVEHMIALLEEAVGADDQLELDDLNHIVHCQILRAIQEQMGGPYRPIDVRSDFHPPSYYLHLGFNLLRQPGTDYSKVIGPVGICDNEGYHEPPVYEDCWHDWFMQDLGRWQPPHGGRVFIRYPHAWLGDLVHNTFTPMAGAFHDALEALVGTTSETGPFDYGCDYYFETDIHVAELSSWNWSWPADGSGLALVFDIALGGYSEDFPSWLCLPIDLSHHFKCGVNYLGSPVRVSLYYDWQTLLSGTPGQFESEVSLVLDDLDEDIQVDCDCWDDNLLVQSHHICPSIRERVLDEVQEEIAQNHQVIFDALSGFQGDRASVAGRTWTVDVQTPPYAGFQMRFAREQCPISLADRDGDCDLDSGSIGDDDDDGDGILDDADANPLGWAPFDDADGDGVRELLVAGGNLVDNCPDPNPLQAYNARRPVDVDQNGDPLEIPNTDVPYIQYVETSSGAACGTDEEVSVLMKKRDVEYDASMVSAYWAVSASGPDLVQYSLAWEPGGQTLFPSLCAPSLAGRDGAVLRARYRPVGASAVWPMKPTQCLCEEDAETCAQCEEDYWSALEGLYPYVPVHRWSEFAETTMNKALTSSFGPDACPTNPSLPGEPCVDIPDISYFEGNEESLERGTLWWNEHADVYWEGVSAICLDESTPPCRHRFALAPQSFGVPLEHVAITVEMEFSNESFTIDSETACGMMEELITATTGVTQLAKYSNEFALLQKMLQPPPEEGPLPFGYQVPMMARMAPDEERIEVRAWGYDYERHFTDRPNAAWCQRSLHELLIIAFGGRPLASSDIAGEDVLVGYEAGPFDLRWTILEAKPKKIEKGKWPISREGARLLYDPSKPNGRYFLVGGRIEGDPTDEVWRLRIKPSDPIRRLISQVISGLTGAFECIGMNPSIAKYILEKLKLRLRPKKAKWRLLDISGPTWENDEDVEVFYVKRRIVVFRNTGRGLPGGMDSVEVYRLNGAQPSYYEIPEELRGEQFAASVDWPLVIVYDSTCTDQVLYSFDPVAGSFQSFAAYGNDGALEPERIARGYQPIPCDQGLCLVPGESDQYEMWVFANEAWEWHGLEVVLNLP